MSKGLCYNFTVKPSNFVQILHDGYGHWLKISTIDAQEGEVYVFDSLYATYCNSFLRSAKLLLFFNVNRHP